MCYFYNLPALGIGKRNTHEVFGEEHAFAYETKRAPVQRAIEFASGIADCCRAANALVMPANVTLDMYTQPQTWLTEMVRNTVSSES